MVMYRGLADDLALMDWLNKYIFPAEAKTVSPEFVRIGTRLAALEMIESGTTTFADMYYFEDDIAGAVHEAGLRAVLGQSVISFRSRTRDTGDALRRAEAFIKKWKDDRSSRPSRRTRRIRSSRHSRPCAMANCHGVPMLIHLAETRDEVKIIRRRTQSPTQYLDSLGLWNGRSLAAHAVWLDAADMTTLAQRGVGVAHNPGSNMKLASGIAAVPQWLEHGMHAGLGTDGAASSNDLDMFEAMRLAALLHRSRRRRKPCRRVWCSTWPRAVVPRPSVCRIASAASSPASRPTSLPWRWTAPARPRSSIPCHTSCT
jgi:5-methylthioadenosine/S-adenosylhomocysteine deaminase